MKSEPMRIGYFTDIHLRRAVPGTSEILKRRCRQMPEVLQRCLERLKSEGVALIICSGDCVDEPDHPEAATDLATVHDIIEAISVPAIVIPGNHDSYPDEFYRIFRKPDKSMISENCRFITFYEDICIAGELDSRRGETSLKTMHDLLSENSPDVKHTILIQHYLIYPDLSDPYNYQNAAEIRAIMETSPRKIFSISGHYHRGISPTVHNGVTYFCGKAICEDPFPYYIIDTDGDEISMQEFLVEEIG